MLAWPKLRLFFVSVWGGFKHHLPTRSHHLADRLVAFFTALAVADMLIDWWQPVLLPLTAIGLVVLLLLLIWLFSFKVDYLGNWLVGSLTLFLFWLSSFGLWLFWDSTWSRLIFLAIFVILSWWYLSEWQRHAQKFFTLAKAAGSTPTMVVGAFTIFCLTATAQSFLVYLATSFWDLLFWFFLPTILLFVGLMHVNNWSLLKQWPYALAWLVLGLQFFILLTWLPFNAYSAGFCLAMLYVVLGLSLRQEALGFINRRHYFQELAAVLVAVAVVLSTAVWF